MPNTQQWSTHLACLGRYRRRVVGLLLLLGRRLLGWLLLLWLLGRPPIC